MTSEKIFFSFKISWLSATCVISCALLLLTVFHFHRRATILAKLWDSGFRFSETGLAYDEVQIIRDKKGWNRLRYLVFWKPEGGILSEDVAKAKSQLELLQGIPTITHLHFSYGGDLALLPMIPDGVPNVEEMEISVTTDFLGPEFFKPLSQCNHLKRVSFIGLTDPQGGYLDMEDDSFQGISELEQVESIQFIRMNLSQCEPDRAVECNSLKTIGFQSCEPIATESLCHILESGKIENLHLSHCRIHLNEVLKQTTRSSITYLELRRMTLEDQDILLLVKKFPELKYLSLEYSLTSGEALEHLKPLSNLETLFLGSVEISPAEIRTLKQLSNLNCLELKEVPLSDAFVTELVALSGHIDELWILNEQWTSRHLKRLGNSYPNIKTK